MAATLFIGNYEFMPPAEEVVDFYGGSPLRTQIGA